MATDVVQHLRPVNENGLENSYHCQYRFFNVWKYRLRHCSWPGNFRF